MYSTTELSNLTGYTNSTISIILKKHNIKAIKEGYKGVKYWDESCLDIIRKEKDKKQHKETIALTTLITAFNIPVAEIRSILYSNGIEPVETRTSPLYCYIKNETYPIESKEVIAQYLSRVRIDDENEHPLVTDKRWLVLNKWPDIVPKCFEDLDKEAI